MYIRPPVRYYDQLASRLREFAAARIVTSLARRPQTISVVRRGRAPNLLHRLEDPARAASAGEEKPESAEFPAITSPALFKRQINVPPLGPRKHAKPIGPPGSAFRLAEDSAGQTMPEILSRDD